MAEAEAEQADLARMPGGLLVNFGTVESLDGMLAAGRYANQIGKPIVFDPVGIGATAFRRATAASERLCTLSINRSLRRRVAGLLDEWQPTVIKGNAAEIGALANSNEVWQKPTAIPIRILKTKPFFSLSCPRLKPKA